MEPTGPVEIKTNVPVRPPAAVTKSTSGVNWHPVGDGEELDEAPGTPVSGISRRSIRRWPWKSGGSVLVIALLLTPGLARLDRSEEPVVTNSSISTMSERPISG